MFSSRARKWPATSTKSKSTAAGPLRSAIAAMMLCIAMPCSQDIPDQLPFTRHGSPVAKDIINDDRNPLRPSLLSIRTRIWRSDLQ